MFLCLILMNEAWINEWMVWMNEMQMMNKWMNECTNQSINTSSSAHVYIIKQRYYFIWEKLKKISEMSITNTLYMLWLMATTRNSVHLHHNRMSHLKDMTHSQNPDTVPPFAEINQNNLSLWSSVQIVIGGKWGWHYIEGWLHFFT
jgi:hypothetical protein